MQPLRLSATLCERHGEYSILQVRQNDIHQSRMFIEADYEDEVLAVLNAGPDAIRACKKLLEIIENIRGNLACFPEPLGVAVRMAEEAVRKTKRSNVDAIQDCHSK
jgi:hypothetical protein